MEKTLLKDLDLITKIKINEYHQYHNYLDINHKRNTRRISNPPKMIVKVPEEWEASRLYNPFYVKKKRKQIAKSLSRKILDRTYEPVKPIIKEIPKKSGGVRKISLFQLPDTVVSDRFYTNLLSKNKHRFSSFSYAYRNDRNVHFAIQDIANELKSAPRIFIAEFDFSNFFGSIDHEYIFESFNKNAFLISSLEKDIIKAFLRHQDEKGIPLGTSISLFLANMICWNLDKSLEKEGLRFARYADDTIIWSKDYSKICSAFDIMNDFSIKSGISINYSKSDGISLLQKKGMPSEFANTKEHFDFLGYRVFVDKIGIKDSSVNKIKRQISFILHWNLLQPVKTKRNLNIPANDEDYDLVVAMSQVRRYLYGNLSERSLIRYLNGTYKRLSFKGIMNYYPLITDVDQMKELDSWLISTILNVVEKRKKLLLEHNPLFNTNQFPFTISNKGIVETFRNQKYIGRDGFYAIPSFLRIYLTLQRSLVHEGIERVMNPNSLYYYDD